MTVVTLVTVVTLGTEVTILRVVTVVTIKTVVTVVTVLTEMIVVTVVTVMTVATVVTIVTVVTCRARREVSPHSCRNEEPITQRPSDSHMSVAGLRYSEPAISNTLQRAEIKMMPTSPLIFFFGKVPELPFSS